MNILLTINDISITGGAERVCINLANALLELNHNVEILSFYRKNRDLPYHTNAKITFYNDFGEDIQKQRFYINPLSKIYFKNLYKFTLSLKVKRDYKHIDAIITNDWTYAPFIKNKATHYIKINHLNFIKYNKRNNLFDTLIVLSNKEFDLWQSHHKNANVIANFIPHIPRESTNCNKKVILSVGRMDNGDQKGFLRLLDIWKILQDSNATLHNWHLVIVGDGELKSQIRDKIHTLNLGDSVTLKPFTKDIGREYLNAGIYAMTSHYEGFGMVLAEAGSYGLPCVAFDIKTGPSDIIKHNESGFLINDNDLQGYANAIKVLMSDDIKRKNMGGKAKNRIKKYFSKETIMQKWSEILANK